MCGVSDLSAPPPYPHPLLVMYAWCFRRFFPFPPLCHVYVVFQTSYPSPLLTRSVSCVYFVSDQNTGILQAVGWGLGSDWVKVAILLGVAPSAVSKLRESHTLNDGQRAMEVRLHFRFINKLRI